MATEVDIHDTKMTMRVDTHSTKVAEEDWIKVGRVKIPSIPNRIAQYSTVVQLPEPLAVRSEGKTVSPVDEEMKKTLERKRIINWLVGTHPLYPISIPGDGNRLLCAVSMAIWGVSDGTEVLMKYMKMALREDDFTTALKHRWMLKRRMLGISDRQEEFDAEWIRLLNIATAPELPQGWFEDLHVFVLAIVLRRPIIVLSQDQGNLDGDGARSSMNNLAGIYLPLLSEPSHCIKSPIVIGYCEHFMPLLGFDGCQDISRQALSCVPIVTSDLKPLKVQFLDPAKERGEAQLKEDYLDLLDRPQTDINSVPVAELHYLPPVKDDLINDIRPERGLKRTVSQIDFVRRSPGSSPDSESAVEICSTGNIPRSEDTDDSYEDDTCAYPNCSKHAVWWPFCYEHSPDSGWAPGGLLYCWNHFVNNKEKPREPGSPEEPGYSTSTADDTPINEDDNLEINPSGISQEIPHIPVKKCVGPLCEENDPGIFDGLCENCYNCLLRSNKRKE